MRRILAFLTLMIVPFCLCASPYAYINASYGISYDTNVFSDPLPSWDEEDMNFDYQKNVSNAFSLSADIFFSSGPAGLSVSALLGIPFHSEVYDYGSGVWGGADALPYITLSIGPTFRYDTGPLDLFLSLRAGIGADDFYRTGITFDIIVDGGIRFFPTERMVVSVGALYDARLMKFYIGNLDYVYEPGYIMLGLGGYVSVGIMVGDR